LSAAGRQEQAFASFRENIVGKTGLAQQDTAYDSVGQSVV
jgi:hypothetical protein